MVETMLGAIRDRDDGAGLALAALAQPHADMRAVPIVPRGLDQQTAHMSVAGLGDGPLPSLLAARVLARD